MFGSFGGAVGPSSAVFVSGASVDHVMVNYGLDKQVVAVRNCRSIGKKDLKLNDACPKIEVDPETYKVTADGEHLTCEPAQTLPLAQLYNLF
jgi:urease subunit alpha